MKYGLIGEKLGHSYSKIIHGMLGNSLYELKEIAPEDLDEFMTKRDFLGINVTLPYKQAVIPYLDEIDESVKNIGAVNTIVNRDGRLCGYNTDYYGMKALISHAGVKVKGCKAVILGSGGTSKTAKAVLCDLGAKEVFRVSRSGKDGAITYAEMGEKHIKKYCQLSKECEEIIKNAFISLNLSARAYKRILKVARTIADLDSSENIKKEHLLEAIQYRSLDKKFTV